MESFSGPTHCSSWGLPADFRGRDEPRVRERRPPSPFTAGEGRSPDSEDRKGSTQPEANFTAFQPSVMFSVSQWIILEWLRIPPPPPGHLWHTVPAQDVHRGA